MRFACFFLMCAIPAGAQGGIVLRASIAGHVLILNDVFLNGAGPFRMLVDTGNATSMVRPEVAQRLNLTPAYSVDHASISGSRRVPVAVLDEVRVASVADRSVEAIIGDVYQAGVDGVLGESWLVRHDYLLDYRNRRVVLDGASPGDGVRLPLRSGDGRPVVVAAIDGRATEVVVDSGASAMVLYEKAGPGGIAVQVRGNGGSLMAQKFAAHFGLSTGRERTIDALRVDVTGLGPGLLPAGAFSSVFVSNREGFVEFLR